MISKYDTKEVKIISVSDEISIIKIIFLIYY